MKNEQLPILNTSEFYWYVLTTIGAGPGTVFPHVPAVAIAVLLGVKVAFVNAICTISSDFFCNGLGYVTLCKNWHEVVRCFLPLGHKHLFSKITTRETDNDRHITI